MVISRADPQATDVNDGDIASNSEVAGEPTGLDLLRLVGSAEDLSRDHQTQVLHRPLIQSYRAWRNEHHEGSKYLGHGWRGRSKLFVPKSRSSARKAMAASAAALFSTEDTVSVTAEHEDDPIQQASAKVINEDLNYRLSRKSRKSGIPWFQIAMGSVLDSNLTGISCSKQYWEYEEVESGNFEDSQEVSIDEETGEERIEVVQKPIMRTVRDRPMIDLIPVENILVDPAAPWFDPIQLGGWFICRYPMHLTDAKTMMSQASKSGNISWIEDISDEVLLKGRIDEERSATRRIREGGTDRYERRAHVGDLDIVWLNENFMRVGGKDYTFWSIGRYAYLSEVREVHEAYPEQDGDRPYVFGVGQMDPHRVFPMSAMESWQPLQQEINDLTNLRLDSLKRNIAPLAKIKRGKNVDTTAVQRRGRPDALLMVDNMDDVQFEKVAGPDGAAYQETSVASNNMDELSGTFSSSSVQNNRQMNETVGGMKLMSGSSNSITEFDLRVWVETWVEPTLRQVVRLLRFYENDEVVLGIAGSKAQVLEKFNYIPTLSDIEHTDVMLRVNVGIGSADPMQKLGKLKAAMDMLLPMFTEMKGEGVSLNSQELIAEIFGAAGFRDGMRFFNFKKPGEQAEPSPEMQKVMAEIEIDKAEVAVKEANVEMEREKAKESNLTDIKIQRMKGEQGLLRDMMKIESEEDARFDESQEKHLDRVAGLLSGNSNGEGQRSPVVPAALKKLSPGMDEKPSDKPAPNAAHDRANLEIMKGLEEVAKQVRMFGGIVAHMNENIQSPADIIRGPDGRPMAVRKGGRIQEIIDPGSGA